MVTQIALQKIPYIQYFLVMYRRRVHHGNINNPDEDPVALQKKFQAAVGGTIEVVELVRCSRQGGNSEVELVTALQEWGIIPIRRWCPIYKTSIGSASLLLSIFTLAPNFTRIYVVASKYSQNNIAGLLQLECTSRLLAYAIKLYMRRVDQPTRL